MLPVFKRIKPVSHRLCKFRNAWIILVLCILFVQVPSMPASASTGLTVQGASLVADVTPGETLTHKITISIGTDDPAIDLIASVSDIGQTTDGSIIPLENATGANPFSAYNFITLDKTRIRLEPGIPQDFIVTAKIPQNAGDGGRYALISIKTDTVGSGSVGIVAAVNIPVYLTLRNSKLIHTGKITGITTGIITAGRPIDIFTTFENTGNHHFKVENQVTVTNSSNELLDEIKTGFTVSSIIPGMSRILKTTFVPRQILSPGTYNIQSRVIQEDGTVLDKASGSFVIKTPLIPPQPPITQTVTPDSSAVLKTGDGAISVSLPAGAVISNTNLTITGLSDVQLPVVPNGYLLADNCFRIDGLNGLLAKEATVTVKYSAADLAKADNDASRLILGRCDGPDSKWTFMSSKIDKSAMTVSTTTDRFSTWALLISPPPNNNLPLIIYASGMGFILIMAAIALFSKKPIRGRTKDLEH